MQKIYFLYALKRELFQNKNALSFVFFIWMIESNVYLKNYIIKILLRKMKLFFLWKCFSHVTLTLLSDACDSRERKNQEWFSRKGKCEKYKEVFIY